MAEALSSIESDEDDEEEDISIENDDDDASKRERERNDVHDDDDDESDRETVDLSICMPFRMGHFSATTACVHAVAHKLGMKL